MAFYTDGTDTYFSLSLRPAGAKPAYVFRLTGAQLSAASIAFPICLVTAGPAAAAVFLMGLASKFRDTQIRISPSDFDTIIYLSTLTVAVLLVLQFGLFLWVRFSGTALLSDHERRSVHRFHVIRGLSLEAYGTFLCCLLVPFAGTFFDPGGLLGSGEDFSNMGTAGDIFMTTLLAGTLAFVFVLVHRLSILVSYQPPQPDR